MRSIFRTGYTGQCCGVISSDGFLPDIGSYYTEGSIDPIAVIAGLVQTGLYLDFFYIYFTKCVVVSLTPTI